jgi:hypothetical protein
VYFLVKVRVDPKKLAEFGARLQQGALDNTSILFTYCLANDPAVGLSVWEVESGKDFDAKFAAWRPYYSEVDVSEVVTPAEAQRLLLQG